MRLSHILLSLTLASIVLYAGTSEAAKKPRLRCPKGSVMAGNMPPKGFEIHCAQKGTGEKGKAVLSASIKNGPLVSYYKDGKVWRRGYYRKGKKHGNWIRYCNNGRKQLEVTYNLGTPVGNYRYFRPDGKVWLRGLYKAGKRYGKVYLFLTQDRAPISCRIKNARLNTCLSKYKGGKVKYRSNLNETSKPSIEEMFYENGKLFARRQLKQGTPSGKVQLFHDNGKKGVEITCRGGKPLPSLLEWSTEGKKIKPKLAKHLAPTLCQKLDKDIDIAANEILISHFPKF